MASIQAQVGQLSELNTTLRRYLEEIVSKIAPNESESLINTETQRLKDAEIERIIGRNSLGIHLIGEIEFEPAVVRRAVLESTSVSDFLNRLTSPDLNQKQRERLKRLQDPFMEPIVLEDLNAIRHDIGLPVWDTESNFEDSTSPAWQPMVKPSRTKRSASKAPKETASK
jgi:hypothetical protein